MSLAFTQEDFLVIQLEYLSCFGRSVLPLQWWHHCPFCPVIRLTKTSLNSSFSCGVRFLVWISIQYENSVKFRQSKSNCAVLSKVQLAFHSTFWQSLMSVWAAIWRFKTFCFFLWSELSLFRKFYLAYFNCKWINKKNETENGSNKSKTSLHETEGLTWSNSIRNFHVATWASQLPN